MNTEPQSETVKVLVSVPRAEMEKITAVTGIEANATALLHAARKGLTLIEKSEELAMKALAPIANAVPQGGSRE